MITTASPRNHELVKSLGADEAFDYRDPDVSNKIKQWTDARGFKDGVRLALDCVSTKESILLSANALGPKGGKVVTLCESLLVIPLGI